PQHFFRCREFNDVFVVEQKTLAIQNPPLPWISPVLKMIISSLAKIQGLCFVLIFLVCLKTYIQILAVIWIDVF
ncbi:MAG: hypothetical protein ACOCQ4_02540, partial [bacterium]